MMNQDFIADFRFTPQPLDIWKHLGRQTMIVHTLISYYDSLIVWIMQGEKVNWESSCDGWDQLADSICLVIPSIAKKLSSSVWRTSKGDTHASSLIRSSLQSLSYCASFQLIVSMQDFTGLLRVWQTSEHLDISLTLSSASSLPESSHTSGW